MSMFMLAEITSNLDLSGLFCLAAIPCVIIVALAYRKGFLIGGLLCFAFLAATLYLTEDLDKEFITNLDKTKWKRQRSCNTSFVYACIYRQFAVDPYFADQDRNRDYNIKIPVSLDNYAVFIPEEEMVVSEGSLFMLSTGQPPVANDYYLYDDTYDSKDVHIEFGGKNDGTDDVIPKWLFHPAAPVIIFGTGSLPAFLILAIGSSLISGGKK